MATLAIQLPADFDIECGTDECQNDFVVLIQTEIWVGGQSFGTGSFEGRCLDCARTAFGV